MSVPELNTYFTGNDSYKLLNDTYKLINDTIKAINGTSKPVNPTVSKVGDFTPFYVAIAISSVILGSILILNIVCCCSKYSEYWLDRHTGNRWIVSIWSSTPHKQPPLDFTELENNYQPVHYSHTGENSEGYSEFHRHSVPPSVSQQPLTSSQEYLELHKRESDI